MGTTTSETVEKKRVTVEGAVTCAPDDVEDFSDDALVDMVIDKIRQSPEQHLSFDVEEAVVNGVKPDHYYVSDGDETHGPYKSEDRAHRRKARWNDEGETDDWLVVVGHDVLTMDSIPFPDD